MSDPISVLPIDLTGLNIQNLIQGEEHSPQPSTTRLIIPRFGAFFASSMELVNAIDQTPLDPTSYKFADVWKSATEQSSQTVATVVILYSNAPASVALRYQAFGGPQSRNAQVLLTWFNEKLAVATPGIDFEQLQDFPDKVDPSHHLHLASHLYGMEYVTDALERLATAINTGSSDSKELARAAINSRVAGLYERTITTVDAVVQEAFYKWRDEINLFFLGCDQLVNLPMVSLEDAAACVAGSFIIQNPQDDKYVNISGLGEFCKGLIERLVQKSTGIGSEYAVLQDPHRGSLLNAKVGSVFLVPSQNDAIKISHRYKEIYPKDYPLDSPMIVEKVGSHPRDRAGLFTAYHPQFGHSWVGILIDSRFTTRIEWFKRYFRGEQMDLEKMLDDHSASIGNVHQENKDQVNLGNVENLPVVTVDDILSETPADKLHTLATLLYAMKAWLENVKLPLGSDGQVDMTANPLLLPKVIFAPCPVNDKASSIEFIESFCDGSDKYAKWSNGMGGFEDKVVELNSNDCKYMAIPEVGTSLGRFCDPVTKSMMERVADGRGGSKTEIVMVNDPACGYVQPQPAGLKLYEFCSGVNMMARYADGRGGFTDVPILINTVKCDGTNFEIPGSTESGGGSNKAKITVSSTHNKIYVGTSEVLSIYFSGLSPNTQYSASVYVQSPAISNNTPVESLALTFRTGGTGVFLKELQLKDEGITPRGVYDNWVVMLSENLESNHITRTFLPGAAPSGNTNPNSSTGVTRPDGGNAGAGDTNEPPLEDYIDINGDPFGSGTWPPVPRFNPLINLVSDKPIIYPGDNEKMVASCSGFMAGQSYTLRYYAVSPAYNNSARVQTFTVNFVADQNGAFEHTLHLYDDGSVPRGTYICTAEVDQYSSASISRQFSTTTEGGIQPKPSPLIVYTCSHTSIVQGTNYTETVVLSGLEPNTKYTVGVTGSYWDSVLRGGIRAYFVCLTDNNGYYRWERTTTDDGVTVVRAAYQVRANVVENNLVSATVFVSYLQGFEVGVPGTPIPRLDYASTSVRINPGDTETQTASLFNATVNKAYVIEWWVKSPSFNNNQDFMTAQSQVTTNNAGNATAVLTTTDDGISTPRGDYQCWVVCRVLNIQSTPIVRTFLGSGGTTPPTASPTLKDAVLSFATSHPTLSVGVSETLTATLTKFIPNTLYAVDLWVKSAALSNGNQPLKAGTISCTTDANGNGVATTTIVENGVTPRGEYQSWAVCQSVTSNTIIRTFVGTTTTYNPVVAYATNLAVITVGTTETQTITLTNARPNTAYTLEFWIQSFYLSNGLDTLAESRSVVTNAQGSATATIQTYDDGVTVPRGSYLTWGRVSELNIRSTSVTRVFQGTPAPTEPPYNPAINYWTNRNQLWVGLNETHSVAISGMRANTTYNIQLWAQSSVIWGGTPANTKNDSIRTNSSGEGNLTWTQVDDGLTPRGTYSNWAVIVETNTRSATFTRVFS